MDFHLERFVVRWKLSARSEQKVTKQQWGGGSGEERLVDGTKGIVLNP